ncbi:membrane protein [Longispora fulva]|nr:membrane protein [Longispora fulva]
MPMSVVRDFFAGVGYLGKGIGLWFRSPRLLALGLIPAIIAGAVLLTAMIFFWVNVGDIATWMTPFADSWDETGRDVFRFTAAALLVGVSLLLGVLLYTALTLAIGDPFYEKISERVEDSRGGVTGEVQLSLARSIGRSIVDSLRLVGKSLLFGIVLFALGFIPVVGQTVVPVLGALVGGWFLTMELTSVPFERRGLRVWDRRRILKGRRALAVGFGTATFLCFLVPGGAILVTPAAVAGATLLAREVLGERPQHVDQG